ncbi:Rho GTPase [Apophysomyces ossiformis]|uniref:Rho GTPase n=1 Tax=Apophysomyces ossiformis TaxID=679940 RepID=A0A8H7BTQ7_9FUNG|nr:Rho GTPase [Apophysomyces ossiformis]
MTKSIQKKLVVIGDGGCGKTSLLWVYRNKIFPERHVPTVFDTCIVNVNVDGKTVRLSLWDTAGQEDFDRLRPLSYPDTDVILICFAIDTPASLLNVQDRWLPEVRHFCDDVPLILVGTKLDLRENVSRNTELNATGHRMVDYEEGAEVAKAIGANYYECSARQNWYVDDVIMAAIRETMTGGLTRLRRKLCTLL